MSTETLTQHPLNVSVPGHDAGSIKVFGFWVYLMSDCILFAVIFATYAVLMNNIAEGPSGKEIFNLPYVLVETFCLLISSVTFGMAMLSQGKNEKDRVLKWLIVTFLFGLMFIGLELNEFHHLLSEGHGPQQSAFLSSYFALVGTHGLHVTIGLVWIIVLMAQINSRGLTTVNNSRLMCLSLFWHFLDIIWICLFTVVYLIGAI